MKKSGYSDEASLCGIPERLWKKFPNCAEGGKCQVACFVPEALTVIGNSAIDGKIIPNEQIATWANEIKVALQAE